jgi:hypothetical protein
LGLATVAACAGPVAQAPFSLRPDTAAPGDLLGPFDGQVVDQSTSTPIASALVIGTWAFESPQGLAKPEAAFSVNVMTRADGTYTLPKLPPTERRSELLRRFTLVVYKAGYSGYRSDLRTDDRTPRHDFAQHDNKARLDRFPAGESHARHLVFLGGGPLLQSAAKAEVVQAAMELSETRQREDSERLAKAKAAAEASDTSDDEKPEGGEGKGRPPGVGALAERLLTLADITEWAAKGSAGDAAYTVQPLAESEKPEPGVLTESIHYRAQELPETYDAALRVYRTASGKDADALWKRLRVPLSTPQLRDAAGDATPLPVPTTRSPVAPLPDVPENAQLLRDSAGTSFPLPIPSSTATTGTAETVGAAEAAPKETAAPLRGIDATLRSYDPKLRVHGLLVLIRKLGVVLRLTCGADLCPDGGSAATLLSRSLGRL